MKPVMLVFLILFAAIEANADIVVSLTGPDGGGELVSGSRYVSFRWVTSDSHFDVSVFAKLAAVSDINPFLGTAYISFGPCCTPNVSPSEFAHSEFSVTSQNSSYIELFQGLTLPPNNYYLTLASTGSGSGLWVVAEPALLMGGLAGGDTVAEGPNVNPVYPPSSNFTSGFRQTQFFVTDSRTPVSVPEPSSLILIFFGLVAICGASLRRT
jgi:hypothetical protein